METDNNKNSLDNQYTVNPMLFLFLFLIIVAYIVFFSYLGNSDSLGENNRSRMFGGIIIIVLVALFVYYAFDYFINSNAFDSIYKLINNKTQPTVQNKEQIGDVLGGILSNKQVFNIPENKYTYTDAKTLCKAFDSRLATYSDLEKSYENGADWCNYGWSEGQMALFPTQKSTYNKLQKIKGHENDCGRPGINGGYIENANAQFGVNCYGNKPMIRPEEAQLMENASPFPITNEEIEFQKKVDYWKTKINEIVLSPFNSKQWNA